MSGRTVYRWCGCAAVMHFEHGYGQSSASVWYEEKYRCKSRSYLLSSRDYQSTQEFENIKPMAQQNPATEHGTLKAAA